MNATPQYSRAIHWCAVLLTIAVFPLIWAGGLVTTYDAGMAVPDWPTTYGYNMFAYPASTWLFGPFDLLVEHSHRLLGAVAGFISIALVVSTAYSEKRKWFWYWSICVLLAVIAQGVLGGVRVMLDQRTFAMIHGCTGPLFFAIATATAVMSSRWWLKPMFLVHGEPQGLTLQQSASTRACWLATALTIAAFLQLMIGAQLRHVTGAIKPSLFMGFVHLHLTMAGVVVTLALLLVLSLGKPVSGRIRGPAWILILVLLSQVALGIATWIVNYALPWPDLTNDLANYTLTAKGFWESMIVTAHMATGSLIISFATVVALRSWRSRFPVSD